MHSLLRLKVVKWFFGKYLLFLFFFHILLSLFKDLWTIIIEGLHYMENYWITSCVSRNTNILGKQVFLRWFQDKISLGNTHIIMSSWKFTMHISVLKTLRGPAVKKPSFNFAWYKFVSQTYMLMCLDVFLEYLLKSYRTNILQNTIWKIQRKKTR